MVPRWAVLRRVNPLSLFQGESPVRAVLFPVPTFFGYVETSSVVGSPLLSATSCLSRPLQANSFLKGGGGRGAGALRVFCFLLVLTTLNYIETSSVVGSPSVEWHFLLIMTAASK